MFTSDFISNKKEKREGLIIIVVLTVEVIFVVLGTDLENA
jgi:hypothetical protein